MEEVKSFPLFQKPNMNKIHLKNLGIVIFYMHIVKGNVKKVWDCVMHIICLAKSN